MAMGRRRVNKYKTLQAPRQSLSLIEAAQPVPSHDEKSRRITSRNAVRVENPWPAAANGHESLPRDDHKILAASSANSERRLFAARCGPKSVGRGIC